MLSVDDDLHLKTENCNPISLFLQTFTLTAHPAELAAHMRLLTTRSRSGMNFTLSDREVIVTFLPDKVLEILEILRVYLRGIISGMPQECVSEASLAAALLFTSVKKGALLFVS